MDSNNEDKIDAFVHHKRALLSSILFLKPPSISIGPLLSQVKNTIILVSKRT
jgi:hypothetical protein